MDSEQKVLDMFDNSVLHLELFRQRCFRPIHELVNYVAEMTRTTKIFTRSFFEKIKNPSFKEEIKNILGELVHKLAINFDKKNLIHYCFLKFGVCILSGTEMKFSCPISAVYYFQNYYQYFLDRKDLKRECSNFEEFILESISLFDPIALRNSFSKKINKSLNEAIYHHEMYRCMHLICDKTVSAQVGSWFGIRGAIDLYVNSTYKYAIELVKDGSLLEQHQSRFIGNGNYANIDINKYALIDFYEDASIRSKLVFVHICSVQFVNPLFKNCNKKCRKPMGIVRGRSKKGICKLKNQKGTFEANVPFWFLSLQIR